MLHPKFILGSVVYEFYYPQSEIKHDVAMCYSQRPQETIYHNAILYVNTEE